MIYECELMPHEFQSQGEKPAVEERKDRLRILVAEDSPTNRLVAAMNLEQTGYVTEIVDNGLRAIQALEEKDFDLALMDVFMPEVDGLEATRIIRQRECGSGRRIPIIAMTATDTQEHRERCLEAGMDGIVFKPVNGDELRRVIAPVLPRIRAARAQDSRRGERSNVSPPVDLAEALDVVDGDVGLLRDVVAMFLQEYREQVTALEEALVCQDAPGVESAAHRLKGVLGNVGGMPARDLARRLEAVGEQGQLGGGAVTVLEELKAEIERVVAFYSDPGWERNILGDASNPSFDNLV